MRHQPLDVADAAPALDDRPRSTVTARPSRALLRSGVPAAVAPLGPGDVDEVLDLHRRLSDRDNYLRFATIHPTALDRYLARTLDPTGGDLTLGARVRGRLVGVVQVLPTGAGTAEMAAVVDPDFRHEGVATVLLEEAAGAAGRFGVRRLQALVLAENEPMRRVLADLGMPMEVTRQEQDLYLEVALDPGDRFRAASEDRHRIAAAAGLQPILRPRSVAVIGAGRSPVSVGRAVLRSLRAGGFRGVVTPVNPVAEELEGFPCRGSVAELPEGVDLAVVCVPAMAVGDVVEECGRVGVRGLLVLTGGLADVPGLPARLRQLIERYGLRMVGPNSVGVAVPGEPVCLNATFAGQPPPAGEIGLVAQSGGVVIAAVAAWQRLGLGLSGMASIGDAYDVGARDLLAWFDEDPGTELVVLYAESEPDLRGLARTAAHLAMRVPVLAVDSGTSAAGARAAASHTARAATPHAVREAAYATAGIQSVPDLSSLSAAVGLLRGQPLPGTGTVAVLTNVGGGGVLTADACVRVGLPVETLPDDLRQRLAAVLPPLASTGNPVDAGAAVSEEAFAAALDCLLGDARVGAVVTVTAPTGVSDPAPGVVSAAAAASRAGGGIPVIDVRLGRNSAVERLDLPGAPAGRFLASVAEPAVAAGALSVAVRRRRWLERPRTPVSAPAGVDVRAARDVVTSVLTRTPEGDWLLPPEVTELCTAAGLRTVPTAWAPTVAEAVAAAEAVDGPVVVKGVVRGVVHKGDAGLLRLPVSAEEVGPIVNDWMQRVGPAWCGAVVQPLVSPGDELLLGAVRDPAAGALVAVGPGGRAADALGHRVHRLAPLSDSDAADMLVETGLFETTHGGSLDVAAVGDCLRRVGWLADTVAEIAEIDVNPLVVTRTEALALDVRIRITATPV